MKTQKVASKAELILTKWLRYLNVCKMEIKNFRKIELVIGIEIHAAKTKSKAYCGDLNEYGHIPTLFLFLVIQNITKI